jgi:hypothetical protein
MGGTIPLEEMAGGGTPKQWWLRGKPFLAGLEAFAGTGGSYHHAFFRASLARHKSGIVQQAARLRLSPISDGEAKCRLQRNSVIRPVWPYFTNRFCADRGSEKIHPPNKTVVYRAKINNHHWHC